MSNDTPNKTQWYAFRGLWRAVRWLARNVGWVLAYMFMPFVFALYGLRKLGGKYETTPDTHYRLIPPENEDFPYRFAEAVDDHPAKDLMIGGAGVIWLVVVISITVNFCGAH